MYVEKDDFEKDKKEAMSGGIMKLGSWIHKSKKECGYPFKKWVRGYKGVVREDNYFVQRAERQGKKRGGVRYKALEEVSRSDCH